MICINALICPFKYFSFFKIKFNLHALIVNKYKLKINFPVKKIFENYINENKHKNKYLF